MYDNYLIYSPQNSNTWYFIPADFGNALERATGATDNSLPDDFVGLGMLYDNVLFRRYFSQKENIVKLGETLEEMHKAINRNFVSSQTEKYRSIVLPRLYSMPDLSSLPRAAEYVETYVAELPTILEEYYSLFYRNLERPLPPYITSCEIGQQTLTFQWLPSSAGVTYTLDIAYDETFINLAYQKSNYVDTAITLPRPEPGIYYIRVTAIDPDGNSQRNANIYTDPFGEKIYGVYELELR
jgi:spore coat protein H